MTIRRFIKRFGTDILGYFCLIIALPVGLLPGPGGVPLIIAGLGLLSVHNPWARQLLVYVKKHSDSLRTILFPKSYRIQTLWDITAVLLAITAGGIALYDLPWYFKLASSSLGVLSICILLSNRSRIDKLIQKTKR